MNIKNRLQDVLALRFIPLSDGPLLIPAAALLIAGNIIYRPPNYELHDPKDSVLFGPGIVSPPRLFAKWVKMFYQHGIPVFFFKHLRRFRIDCWQAIEKQHKNAIEEFAVVKSVYPKICVKE